MNSSTSNPTSAASSSTTSQHLYNPPTAPPSKSKSSNQRISQQVTTNESNKTQTVSQAVSQEKINNEEKSESVGKRLSAANVKILTPKAKKKGFLAMIGRLFSSCFPFSRRKTSQRMEIAEKHEKTEANPATLHANEALRKANTEKMNAIENRLRNLNSETDLTALVEDLSKVDGANLDVLLKNIPSTLELELLVDLTNVALNKEIDKADEINTFLRGNSLATKLFGLCLQRSGLPEANSKNVDAIKQVMENPTETDTKHIENLATTYINGVIEIVNSNRSPALAKLFQSFKTATETKFPGEGTKKLTNVFFLRFANAKLVTPALLDKHREETITLQNVLQCIFNQQPASSAKTQPFNGFITSNFNAVDKLGQALVPAN